MCKYSRKKILNFCRLNKYPNELSFKTCCEFWNLSVDLLGLDRWKYPTVLSVGIQDPQIFAVLYLLWNGSSLAYLLGARCEIETDHRDLEFWESFKAWSGVLLLGLHKHKGSDNEMGHPWAIDVSCLDYSNMQRFVVLCSLANWINFCENFWTVCNTLSFFIIMQTYLWINETE